MSTSNITLLYTDTRPLTKASATLPLLSTLRHEDAESVTRFYQLRDRHMSLASQLLKYYFIHRTAKVPWSSITISRTEAPHKRPFWANPGDKPALEFNVSHQNGLVGILGCTLPGSTTTTTEPTTTDPTTHSPATIRLGLDITSPTELRKRPQSVTTEEQFYDWADTFTSAFSEAELDEMKYHRVTMDPFFEATEEDYIYGKMRRFYTFWALKEAYIKMTGEALLAPWLRELEFRGGVNAPKQEREEEVEERKKKGKGKEGGEEMKWIDAEGRPEPWLRGEQVEGVRMEVKGLGPDYIVAMAVQGVEEEPLKGAVLRRIDIVKDIGPCAEGKCQCLDEE
ncbi:MAG: hypothetical protein Q9227_003116 [Pyrenula ochraceoflavens]